jgi:hypothetical protein
VIVLPITIVPMSEFAASAAHPAKAAAETAVSENNSVRDLAIE